MDSKSTEGNEISRVRDITRLVKNRFAESCPLRIVKSVSGELSRCLTKRITPLLMLKIASGNTHNRDASGKRPLTKSW